MGVARYPQKYPPYTKGGDISFTSMFVWVLCLQVVLMLFNLIILPRSWIFMKNANF